jgi:hypothetical protein
MPLFTRVFFFFYNGKCGVSFESRICCWSFYCNFNS